MRERGFEVISAFEGQGIHLPVRKTARSAGYDIESAADVVLQPGELCLVPTGLKAFMKDDEFLAIYIRSSMAIKHHLLLVNCTGIIDADYYNNEDNEGHIMVAVRNEGDKPFAIHKGERIAQGIFQPFLKTFDDEAEGLRKGGVGSTGV
jgi:dUTP pyrophosphatase